MDTDTKIRQLSLRIAEQFNSERIIPFGSRARGRARRDSDVDLLVVIRFKGPGGRTRRPRSSTASNRNSPWI